MFPTFYSKSATRKTTSDFIAFQLNNKFISTDFEIALERLIQRNCPKAPECVSRLYLHSSQPEHQNCTGQFQGLKASQYSDSTTWHNIASFQNTSSCECCATMWPAITSNHPKSPDDGVVTVIKTKLRHTNRRCVGLSCVLVFNVDALERTKRSADTAVQQSTALRISTQHAFLASVYVT